MMLLWVLILLLDVAAVVDMLGKHAPDTEKIVWILIVLFFPLVGAILYFIVGRRRFGT